LFYKILQRLGTSKEKGAKVMATKKPQIGYTKLRDRHGDKLTPRQVCEAKKRYVTEAAANFFASADQGQYGNNLRPYLCKVCDGWHLTSRPLYRPKIYPRQITLDDVLAFWGHSSRLTWKNSRWYYRHYQDPEIEVGDDDRLIQFFIKERKKVMR